MDRELAQGFRIRRDSQTGEKYLEVSMYGLQLEGSPILNKGTGFPYEEREAFGLVGLLPPRQVSIDEQAERVMLNFRVQRTALDRYGALMALLDRNETLFYRVLLEHLEEMLPVVYTPTVGEACQKFGRLYRRARGLYLTPDDTPRVDEILSRWPYDDVRVIVVTDGERVLGLGDLGAGGMGISIGKVSLYVAGAGIHPAQTLAVCLDTGTNNETLLADELYLGQPHRRVRGTPYDELVAAFLRGVERRWPNALVQFEDFAMGNAFRILATYRDQYRCFNDDIQGTGAVALAGVLAGARLNGQRVDDLRVVIVGAGSAGIGIGRALSGAGAQVWMLDVDGLLTTERSGLLPEQQPFARDEAPGDLLEVAGRVRPHVLIGVTGQRGTFTEAILHTMDGPRPMVFPLSNPNACAECTPEEARSWTNGRAIVATGSPFPDTSQCNNVYVFPGIGLGVMVAEATRVTDAMVRAAAEALAACAHGDQLYPPMTEIRAVSRAVAAAVAHAAVEDGVAPRFSDAELAARLEDAIWEPQYLPYRRG